jgi:hypothetical protein
MVKFSTYLVLLRKPIYDYAGLIVALIMNSKAGGSQNVVSLALMLARFLLFTAHGHPLVWRSLVPYRVCLSIPSGN